MPKALKYNKIVIAERFINKIIRYVGEYQLKFKHSTKEINNLINVCPEVNSNLCTWYVQQQLTLDTTRVLKVYKEVQES